MIADRQRFEAALAAFDAANAEDPNDRELIYARRMTACLERIAPQAPEVVRLAARAQHIRRWTIPRADYPAGRQGYRKWRTDLGRFHAETAGRILRECGYDDPTIDRVGALLRKERLKADPDVQLLEDVICLVFLEHYFADFARQHDEDKLVDIVRKTWRKMSERGHRAAAGLELPPDLQAIVGRALAGASPDTP